MGDHARARRGALAAAAALLLLTAKGIGSQGSRAEPERPHALVSFGGALGGIGGYEGYGLGLLLRAGAELPLFPAGGTGHALVLSLEGGRFPGLQFDTDFLFEGVQLDLTSLRVDWRLYPWRTWGLHVDAGSGILLARDRISLLLPTRKVSATEWRVGVPIEVGTGWVVAEHFDVSLRYSQIVFTAKAPATFGFLELALGVRL